MSFASGSHRVIRGGSWCGDPQYAWVAYRYRFTSDLLSSGLSLRLMRRR
jgi:formylglycine-generating enzyme required for sulfatase activity